MQHLVREKMVRHYQLMRWFTNTGNATVGTRENVGRRAKPNRITWLWQPMRTFPRELPPDAGAIHKGGYEPGNMRLGFRVSSSDFPWGFAGYWLASIKIALSMLATTV